MVSIFSLWLPIILSSVVVFFVSFIIHMVFTYHNTDFKKLPSEDQVMDDLRKANIPPGEYSMPFVSNNKERKTPEYVEKLNKGPLALITVMESGPPKMGTSLFQWFIYCIIVGIFAAYIAGHALQQGASYLSVFRFTGCTAFIGYSMALLQNSIWFKRSWSATLKSIIDGLIYALFTAGVFGWLWPV
jgi:hypothetical protein